MAKFKIKLQGQTNPTEIEVNRQGDEWRVIADGRATPLRLLHHDGLVFAFEYERADGTHRYVRAAGVAGETRQLWVNGRTLTYQRVAEHAGHQTADDDIGSLSATIPAVVSQTLVNEGDIVTAGDKLILLESMKMVIPIQAPHDGVVTRLNCAPGDAVQPGVPLVELRPVSQ